MPGVIVDPRPNGLPAREDPLVPPGAWRPSPRLPVARRRRPRRPRRADRPSPAFPSSSFGYALLGVLFLLGGLLVGAAAFFHAAWVDFRSSSNTAAAGDALRTAEAGLHHLWSLLEPAPDFAAAAAWAGGAPPFAGAVPYDVRVAVVDGALHARSEAFGARGARARVEAIFHREERFRPVAPLLLGEDLADVRGGGTIEIETAGDGDPAIAAAGDAAAGIASAGGLEAATAAPFGLVPVLPTLRARPDRIASGVLPGGTWGSTASPEVVLLAGASELDEVLEVHGILVADGPLHVRGELMVEGLLIARSGLRVDGRLAVSGVVWVVETIELAGALAVRADASALDRADAIREGVLPRRAVLGGWRELW